ncbi:hypothetical protein [Bifidobacterium miconisargentati]|uniref:hypothetical protein n=1 Tax=Bifidobacterium miconisargentati TaxID=2834437 RepID=UPI001BDBEE0D|nr:hypothetical protein [Bifidobacterium miconisargentati]MBW3090418.1 hypothetical protein [Bifidobacterium miconisargentati]
MRGKNFTVIILTGILALGLTGCGDHAETDQSTEAVTKSECSRRDAMLEFSTCVITMPDSRRVTCIIPAGGYPKAMSCDWAHADGADQGAE